MKPRAALAAGLVFFGASVLFAPLLAAAAVLGGGDPGSPGGGGALLGGAAAGGAAGSALLGDGASSAASAIPPAYLADFEASGSRFGVPWGILAGIYRLECDFGRSALAGCNPPGTENQAGAQGPGQFLAPTWRRSLAPGQLITPGPPTATDVAGYATDGDGDGIADPWDPADAVASTARLLAVNGAGAGNLSGAVWAYNHDPTYVEEVLALSTAYQSATPVTAGTPAAGSGPGQTSGSVAGPGTSLGVGAPAAVAAVLGVARAQLGTPYQWGGAGPAGFDCSGLVMVAFAAAGVGLPHNAAAQYEVTAGRPAPLNGLRPGDLVFFGTSVPTIEHVGIYVGGGQMIDAPHTGAVVRIEPIGWSDLLVATRPLS